MTVTPNMSLYLPVNGQSAYGPSFESGMINIDNHDHSGGPLNGVPIGSAGIADGSITYEKLNANVVDPTTGIGVSVANPNQLQILGLLKNIFQIVTATGIIAKNGSNAFARTITGTANQIAVTNGDGASGNPTLALSPIVTNVTQPAFIVSATPDTNTTGNGEEYTVLFNTIVVNQGGGFNTGTYTYTAPATGLYLITARVRINNMNSSNTSRLRIWKNGSIEHNLNRLDTYAVRTNDSPGEYTMIGSELMNLSSGDAIFIGIRVDQTSTNTNINVLGASFSGVKIC